MSVIGKKTQKAIEVYVFNRLSNAAQVSPTGEPSTDDVDNIVTLTAEIFKVDHDDVRYYCNLPR